MRDIENWKCGWECPELTVFVKDGSVGYCKGKEQFFSNILQALNSILIKMQSIHSSALMLTPSIYWMRSLKLVQSFSTLCL